MISLSLYHTQEWERSYLLTKIRNLVSQNRAMVGEVVRPDGQVSSASTGREPVDTKEELVLPEFKRRKKEEVAVEKSQVVVAYVLGWMKKEEFTELMQVMG